MERILSLYGVFRLSKGDKVSRESEETQKNLSKFQNRYWKAEDYYLESETPTGEGGFSHTMIRK